MKKNQAGFTLVELMIATSIFAIILLAATATLIQVGRMYYKGVITSRTQNAARTITDDIARTLQFSSGEVYRIGPSSGTPPAYAVCFADKRLSFALNIQSPEQVAHALWQDTISTGPATCSTNPVNLTSTNPGGVNGKDLLDPHMRLTKLDVVRSAGDPTLEVYNVTVGVAYGETDLFNLDGTGNPVSCKGTVVGGQWCAMSEINTQVYRRAKN
jgi:prepilin-type N-terminal cleavage/methylation domain-containing protein